MVDVARVVALFLKDLLLYAPTMPVQHFPVQTHEYAQFSVDLFVHVDTDLHQEQGENLVAADLFVLEGLELLFIHIVVLDEEVALLLSVGLFY